MLQIAGGPTFHGLGMTKQPLWCRARKAWRFSDGVAMGGILAEMGREGATAGGTGTIRFLAKLN